MTVDLPTPALRVETPLEFVREWIEFPDPADAEHVVRADLTWLLSRWHCIYGAGCPGIVADQPDDGCCVHGAFFTDKADEKRVRAAAGRLSRETWQHYRRGFDNWTEWDLIDTEDGEEEQRRTAVVDGACIFLNRPGFAGGEGCALHGLALREGVHPLTLKPDVCWHVPIRRDSDWVTRLDQTKVLVTTVGEYDRRAWGEGGHDLSWWCSSSPDAHTAPEAVYIGYAAELTELIGAAAYAELARLCAEREKTGLIAEHPATVAARTARSIPSAAS